MNRNSIEREACDVHECKAETVLAVYCVQFAHFKIGGIVGK
jgi:hypothetical protein